MAEECRSPEQNYQSRLSGDKVAMFLFLGLVIPFLVFMYFGPMLWAEKADRARSERFRDMIQSRINAVPAELSALKAHTDALWAAASGNTRQQCAYQQASRRDADERASTFLLATCIIGEEPYQNGEYRAILDGKS